MEFVLRSTFTYFDRLLAATSVQGIQEESLWTLRSFFFVTLRFFQNTSFHQCFKVSCPRACIYRIHNFLTGSAPAAANAYIVGPPKIIIYIPKNQ